MRIPLLLAMLLVCVALAGACASDSPANAQAASGAPLVLAYYHPWYGTPYGPAGKWNQWGSWAFPTRYDPNRILANGWQRDIGAVDYPLIGPYDISDPEIVRWHMRLAKAAGIDGFITSWWKTPYYDPLWTWQAALFQSVFLPVAEQEGFKICVLDECAHYLQDYSQLVSRAKTWLPQFAQSPAYLRINGEPVWMVYQVWDGWITPAIAQQYCQEVEAHVGPVYWIFDRIRAQGTSDPAFPGARLVVQDPWPTIPQIDCFGTYSLFTLWRATTYNDIRKLYTPLVQDVHSRGKLVQVPIHPGHDNTPVTDTPFIADRRSGDLYRDFIRAAREANPDIIAICSFNEWGEGTGIEPAWNYADPYMYMKITAEELTGAAWKTPPLPPLSSVDPLIRGRLLAISGAAADNLQATHVTIRWNTDNPATSQLVYAPAGGASAETPEDAALKTSHRVQLTGLQPNTSYTIRARSRNAEGLVAESQDIVITTRLFDDIIIDNTDAGCTTTGEWNTGAMAGGWEADYLWANTDAPEKTATFRPAISRPGPYDVYVYYLAGPNRSAQSKWTVVHAGGSEQVTVNQQTNGSQWVLISHAREFAAGSAGCAILSSATGDASTAVVIADAVKFVYLGDIEPPTQPTGLAAAALATDRMQLTWTASTDNVGVEGYAVFRGGAQVGESPTPAFTDSGLQPNTAYTYTVAAFDEMRNISAQSASVVRYTLSVPPSPETLTCDKAAGAWHNTAAFTFTAVGGFGEGTLARYRVAWNQNPSHTFTISDPWWFTSPTRVQNAGAGDWYLHVRGFNGNQIENGSCTFGPYRYDGTAPVIGAVSVAGAYTDAAGPLVASWSASDPQSGIAEYRYAVGTGPDAIESVLPWTSAGTATAISSAALPLVSGTSYCVGVQARNSAGTWSATGVSAPTTAADVKAAIADAKGLEDGKAVILRDKVVTAAFDGGPLYISEGDRSSGLRVNASSASVGSAVDVAGVLATLNGERVITLPEVGPMSPGIEPKPLFLPNRALGGAALNAHTPGVPGGIGPNNIGLLVRTSGTVTGIGEGCVYIDDGSGLRDGTLTGTAENAGVRIICDPSGIEVGDRLIVAGISSCFATDSGLAPRVVTRSPADVVRYR